MGNFWLDYDKNNKKADSPVKFVATIGDGINNTFLVGHNLSSTSCIIQCYDQFTYLSIPFHNISLSWLNPNVVQVSFTFIPPPNGVRVVIVA